MESYSARYDKSYALAVGIDLYRHDAALPPLQTARNGAVAVADLLINQFSFDEVITLFDVDATKSAIEDAIASLRSKTRDDDRLVVYFAGHGIGLKGTVRTEGWLAAHDSDHTRHYRLLRMADLADPNYTRAKHVLAIIDACHSGMALAYEAPRAPAAPPDRQRALEHFLTRRSYQVLSSANSLETATDAPLLEGHTPFTGYLLDALSSDTPAARDPVTSLITSDTVARYIRSSMAANFRSWQGPQAGILPGDGGGVLVWQIPSLIETLPSRLARALQNEDPDTRYYAVAEAANLASDPQYGATVRAVLQEMVTNDPDADVRSRAFEAVRHFSAITEERPAPEPIRAVPPEPPVIEQEPEPDAVVAEPEDLYEEPQAAITAARPESPPAAVRRSSVDFVPTREDREPALESRPAISWRRFLLALAVALVGWGILTVIRLNMEPIAPIRLGTINTNYFNTQEFLTGIVIAFVLLFAIRLLVPGIKLIPIAVASLFWGISNGFLTNVVFYHMAGMGGSSAMVWTLRTITPAIVRGVIVSLLLTQFAVRGWRKALTWLVVGWAAITAIAGLVPIQVIRDSSRLRTFMVIYNLLLVIVTMALIFWLERRQRTAAPPSITLQKRALPVWLIILGASILSVALIVYFDKPALWSGPKDPIYFEKLLLVGGAIATGPAGGFLIGVLSGNVWSFYDALVQGAGGLVVGLGYYLFVWRLQDTRPRRIIKWVLVLIGYAVGVEILLWSFAYNTISRSNFDQFWYAASFRIKSLLPIFAIIAIVTTAWVAFAPEKLRRLFWIEEQP